MSTYEEDAKALGLNDNRVKEDGIESLIVSERYFTAAQGVLGAQAWEKHPTTTIEDLDFDDNSLCLLTFCVLVLKNGFTVTGEAACADPANYREELGRKYARENAIKKIWPLEGYLLKQRLYIQNQIQQITSQI